MLFVVAGLIFIYIISFICCQARMAQIYEVSEELDLRKRQREENIFDKTNERDYDNIGNCVNALNLKL